MGPCTANARLAANSGYLMSWHHHHLLCGQPETLPANNISDRCAAVGKVLRSLAMPTTVHNDVQKQSVTVKRSYNVDLKDDKSVLTSCATLSEGSDISICKA